MGVVAITFVTEARSKSVAGVTAKSPHLAKDARNGAPGAVDWTSKAPPSRKEREKDGAPVGSLEGDS